MDVFGLQRNLKTILVGIFVVWTALIGAFTFLVYYASWQVELYQIGAVYICFGLINGASGPIALAWSLPLRSLSRWPRKLQRPI